MPSNLESNLKTILDKFTPDILGMFWVSNEELSRDLLGFDEFNYLFDGLISQYLYGQTVDQLELRPDKVNIFFTNNFNHKLFLIHLKIRSEIANVLNEHMTLILKNTTSEKKKILIFNQTQNKWDSDLQKCYPQIEFINLELSKM